jgi:hypothetical protein
MRHHKIMEVCLEGTEGQNGRIIDTVPGFAWVALGMEMF